MQQSAGTPKNRMAFSLRKKCLNCKKKWKQRYCTLLAEKRAGTGA
jgi:hypothetical protein